MNRKNHKNITGRIFLTAISMTFFVGCTEPKTSGEADYVYQTAKSVINNEPVDSTGYIDLTIMTANGALMMIGDMMDPKNFEYYVTKTIRTEGIYSYMKDEETGKEYHSCIVMSEDGQYYLPVEFDPAEDTTLPDPDQESMITVEGLFDVYYEDGTPYVILRQAKVDIMASTEPQE